MRLPAGDPEKVSMAQSDARAQMTGRIVDSYTNIATVKLFSHSQREQAYAREAMAGFLDKVHPQMRLATRIYTLLYALKNRGLKKGLATLCIGGGEATAMAVELL